MFYDSICNMKNIAKNKVKIKKRNEIKNELNALADNKFKDFSEGLSMGNKTMIGVRTPILREYAKELSNNFYEEYDELSCDTFEEILLKGMMIGYANISIEDKIKYLDLFVPLIDNWAVCDMTCATLKFTKNIQEQMWEYINEYIDSSKEFYVRFAIVMMLDYYVNEEYIDRIIEIINNLDYKGNCNKYYIKMAVAWLIAEIIIKQRNKGMNYLKRKNNLDDFTFNRAIQKCIDSYRVSDKDKNILRKLRRK